MPTNGQSTSLVLSHQHCELQLLGKRPSGHIGSGKDSPVAQGSLEVGGRKNCRTEIKPESWETAGWERDQKVPRTMKSLLGEAIRGLGDCGAEGEDRNDESDREI